MEAALDRYARAFPKAELPFLHGAAGPEAQRVAVELLDRAVSKGRPLDHWAIMRVLSPRRLAQERPRPSRHFLRRFSIRKRVQKIRPRQQAGRR